MTRQISLKKSKQGFDAKIDLLRKVTVALLDEVRTLDQTKTIEIEKGINFDHEIRSFEIQLIERALEQTGGNQIRAAKLLNLKHTTLHAKIKRFKIGLGRSAMIPAARK